MSKYITGAELFSQGYISAIELGELCRDGEITAWLEPGLLMYSSKEQYDCAKQCACHSTSVILFPFDLETFVEEYKEETGGCYNTFTAEQYCNHLSSMTFELAEIQPYLHNQEPRKITLKIPSALFAGKIANAAYAAMKGDNFSDDIIAFVLVRNLGISQEEAAEILFPDESKDISTLRKRISNMLKSVEDKYMIRYI